MIILISSPIPFYVGCPITGAARKIILISVLGVFE
jgi:hypothetical protein|tara:strand:- start:346 stop:450 length:105 start_codon:yes stop_codon:yes gene_type:complete